MISVGIDVSKDKSTVCMLRPYGEVVEAPHNIDHTEQALNALIERIKSFEEDVKVVLEGNAVGKRVEYEEMHSRDDGKIEVYVTDVANTMLKVYIDDVVKYEMTL